MLGGLNTSENVYKWNNFYSIHYKQLNYIENN